MSDQTPAPESGAPQAEEQQEDPFAGFQSEAYDGGTRIADAPAANEEPKPKPEPEEPAPPEGEEEETPPVAGETAPPRKTQTAQERINELTRARREAERREADTAREVAELRKQMDVLLNRTPPVKESEKEAQTPEAKGPPKPEDFEFGELDAAYIAAVVDYHTERRLEEFAQRQAQAQQQTAAQAKFQQTVERGIARHADFEEKVIRGAQDGSWPLSETLGLLLVESDVGEDIAYHLATNPEEAKRVYSQAPLEQARYFGRLEAKFSAARAAAAGGNEPAVTPATTRAPQAPPPVTPARGAGGTFTATASSDDFAAFERAALKSN